MANPIILCVDDEELPRTLRSLVLGRRGYEVITAVSAAEALEVLDRHHVDLLLTDHIMPHVVGTELARQARTRRPSLPVIIVSGVDEIPEGAVYADRFVSKVEGPDALIRSIAEVLEEYQVLPGPRRLWGCASAARR